MGQKETKVSSINIEHDRDPCDKTEVSVKDDSNKNEPLTVKDLVRNFAEQTTMHGLSRALASDRHIILRCVWMLLVLAAGGWAIYNVMKIGFLYSTYPVVTVVDVEFKNQLAFPAVTICNLNLLRLSKYLDNTLFMDLRNDLSGKNINASLDFDSEDHQLAQIKTFIRSLPFKKSLEMGHQLDNMLLGCSFAGVTCDIENFTMFFNQKYGNCFIFNKNSVAPKVTAAGPKQGLKLLLLVEQYEYMPQSPSVGIKMVLHPQHAMPFPESSGMILTPGFTTAVGVSKKSFHRTGPPFGECAHLSAAENLELNMFTPSYGVNYSSEVCINTCYQVMVIDDCNCCDADFPCTLKLVKSERFGFSNTFNFSDDIKFCEFNDSVSDIGLCVQNVKTIVLTDKGEVDPMEKCFKACKPQCTEEVFNHQVSMATWHVTPNVKSLIQSTLNDAGKNLTVNDDFLRSNIIRVEVYFSQLNVEKAVTNPAYDWLRLLGDIGGQVSLWLGFSVITAVEMCQLLFDLVRLLFFNACKAVLT